MITHVELQAKGGEVHERVLNQLTQVELTDRLDRLQKHGFPLAVTGLAGREEGAAHTSPAL